MEAPSNPDQDRWMEKIANALRSFRAESERKAQQMGPQRTAAAGADGEARARE